MDPLLSTRWFYFLLLGVCLTAAACTRKAVGEAPRYEQFQDQFQRTPLPTATPTETPSQTPSRISCRLYIDGSDSMLGYTVQPDSSFNRLLGAHLVKLTGTYEIACVRATEQDLQRMSVGQAEAACKNPTAFFSGSTSLVKAFNDIPAPGDNPGLAVILTDGVQSDGRGNISSAVGEAIRRKLQAGWKFRLFGFQGAYQGKVFSERVPGTFLEYHGDRAFYLFAFAQNEAILTVYGRTLSDELSAQSVPAARVPVQGFTLDWPEDRYGDHLQKEREPMQVAGEDSPWVTFLSVDDSADLPSTLELDGHINFARGGQAYSISDPQRLHFDVQSRVFDCATSSWKDGPTMLAPLVGALKKPCAIPVTLRLPLPAPASWTVLRLTFTCPANDLGLPAWVSDWSTGQDEKPSELGKTYLLHDLLCAAGIHSLEGGERELGAQYIVVGGR